MEAHPATRSLTADDLIQLPRFDVVTAIALGDRLLETARVEGELPRPIKRAKDTLEECLVGLRAAADARRATQIMSAETTDPEVVHEADTTLDACWTGLFEWLSGLARLPAPYGERIEARALLDELYPDDLGFLFLAYQLEWEQSDRRLGRMTGASIGERLRRLGGGVFIEAIQAAHWQYGKLLGLPRVPGTSDDEGPSAREALDRFGTTLRVYALKVTAHVEIDEPETGALSKRLLEPLLSHDASRRTTTAKPSSISHA